MLLYAVATSCIEQSCKVQVVMCWRDTVLTCIDMVSYGMYYRSALKYTRLGQYILDKQTSIVVAADKYGIRLTGADLFGCEDYRKILYATFPLSRAELARVSDPSQQFFPHNFICLMHLT